MNLCVNCKHLERNGEQDVWYTYLCAARPYPIGVDPVTGKKKPFMKNDLGRVVFTNDRLPSCRDINLDGACPDFKAKD